MIRKAVQLSLCLFLPCTWCFGQVMSHEEEVVRTAYARLAYASQLDAIYHLSSEAWRRGNPPLVTADVDRELASAELTFHLSNFVIGKTTDILDVPIATLVSPEPKSVLETTFAGHSIQEDGMNTPSQFFSAEARWRPSHGISAEAEATVERMSLAAVFRANEPSSPPVNEKYPRYVTFLVTVTYMGITAGPYKALFLFGHDSTGKEIVLPYDTTTSDGPAMALGTPLYPKALVETNRRRLGVVSRWLDSSRVGDSCAIWQHDVCCNLSTLRCGMTASMLQTARSKPLPATTLKMGEEGDHANEH